MNPFSESSLFMVIALSAVVLLLLVLICLLLKKNSSASIDKATDLLFRGQAELAGRLSQFSEASFQQQIKLADTLNEQKISLLKIMDDKLLAVTKSVGDGLQSSANRTNETILDLRERLAKIDAAQQKIANLSEQVVSLQEILSNKQARGAFGEIQLNDIVKSALPPSAYTFQYILSNQKRADCILRLPNPPGPIVIDSKFPLESYQALQNGESERDKTEAARLFRIAVSKHIKDIAEKYIIAGETAESALMFLPSESVYAELHTNFTDLVEYSYRSRVWIVSPTTLMATLNTVRAVLKDAVMQQQAGIIQKEVLSLIEDITRLDERVDSLSKHFEQAGKDIEDIRISAGKISRKIDKIEDLQVGEQQPQKSVTPAAE